MQSDDPFCVSEINSFLSCVYDIRTGENMFCEDNL